MFSLYGVFIFFFIFYRNGDLTESTSDQEEEEIEPKFFSKENVKKNWFRQVKVLVLIGMAIVCTVSTVNYNFNCPNTFGTMKICSRQG